MHGTFLQQSESPRPLVKRSNDWTLKEHEVVVSHWPDVKTIERLLPHRTRCAIVAFAGKCNLRKEQHVWTGAQTSLLRKRVGEGKTRIEIASELGLTKLQVLNRCRYLGLRNPVKPPAPTGHLLMDAIRKRSFELNISRRELDEACRSGEQFQRWSPARTIAQRHILKAIEVLDGQLTVEWSNARD